MKFTGDNLVTILKICLVVFLVYWLVFVLTSGVKISEEYKNKIDSLNTHIEIVQKKQDSLSQNIIKYNSEIEKVDKIISNIKNEKTIIKEYYHEKIISVDTFNSSDIDKFFSNRYGYNR